MKKFFFLFAALTILSTQLLAQQSWQWGRRGGGGVQTVGSGGTETVNDMALDPAGNVYVLSVLDFRYNDVTLGSQAITGWGRGDIVITSYNCNGGYRWSKVIGGPAVETPVSLRTDTLGGVYVSGNVINYSRTVHFDADSVITNSNKELFVIKYDTAGIFKWLRQPQPDTVTAWTLSQGNRIFDMDADKAGNTYSMTYLPQGAYGTGANTYVVATPGVHMLRYDRNGVFLGGNTMAITVEPYNTPIYKWWLTRTPSGKFIVNGTPSGYGNPAVFGTTTIDRTGFVASFNSNGTSHWVKKSTNAPVGGGGLVINKAVVNAQGDLYITGSTNPGDGFGGVTFPNPGYFAYTGLPFGLKLDSNGNTIWSKHGVGNSYAGGEAGALTTNGEFVIGGGWTATLKWSGSVDSFVHPAGHMSNIFITRFNAQTGAYISMDTLYSPPGDNNLVTAMAADKKGNAYLGGYFQTELKVAGTSLLTKPGDYSDFFITKYGQANCNCTPPVASFTKLSQNNAARSAVFQYTGTTANLDSVVWVWGNGQRLRLTGNFTGAITRNYDTGSYNVCVTAYSAGCGSNATCQNIYFAPVGIEEVNAASGTSLLLAPNPSTTETQISYQLSSHAGSLEVYDLAGRMLYRKTLTQKSGTEKLSIAEYVPGLYLVVLREAGEVVVHRRLSVVR